MPAELTIITEDDIRDYERNKLDTEFRRVVEKALHSDDRARSYLRRIRTERNRNSAFRNNRENTHA